jgi:hypothetical protein
MFKTIAMINCDVCGGTFEQLAVCGDKDPTLWDAITSDLERAAESSGWYLYRQEHRCHNCMLDAFYNQQQKKR